MNLRALLLLMLATAAIAQTPPVNPTASCSVQWPAGISYDGTTFSVPQLKVGTGTPPSDGLYLVSFTSGLSTFVPYVPPTPGTGSTAVPFIAAPIAVQIQPSSKQVTYVIYTVAPAVIPPNDTVNNVYYVVSPSTASVQPGNKISLSTLVDFASPFIPTIGIYAPNTITARWKNVSASPALFTGGAANVWVN